MIVRNILIITIPIHIVNQTYRLDGAQRGTAWHKQVEESRQEPRHNYAAANKQTVRPNDKQHEGRQTWLTVQAHDATNSTPRGAIRRPAAQPSAEAGKVGRAHYM